MKSHVLFFAMILGTIGFAQSQTARLQVIHNSADAAASQVDVYLNGSLLLDNFAFRTATPFIDAPAGTQITIDIAPASSLSVAESIASFPFTLTANETYIVVANGIVSSSGYSPANPFNLYVYPLGREVSSDNGTTDVIVFHGATDAPVVDVNEITLGGATIIDGMAYGDFTGYLSLPVKDYGLQILPDDQSSVVVEYLSPLSSLSLNGKAITVVASGFLNPAANSNGPAFGLWVALPAGGALVELPVLEYSRLQVIHNSADALAEEVDVYLNGNLLLDDFAFRTATPFIDIASDLIHEISVAPASSASVNDAIADFPVQFDADETYQVIANGIVSPTGYSPAEPFNLYVYPMAKESSGDNGITDINVFHGATDAPSVDVNEVTLGGATIIDGMSYGDFTGYLSLPVKNYGLQILPDDQSSVVVEYLAPVSSLGLNGSAITVIASGFLNPAANSNGPAFGLWVALPSGGALVQLPMLEYSRLQVIHNSSDIAAEEVDVYLNGNLLLDNFAFRTATPYIDIASDLEHQIAVAGSSSVSVGEAIATFPVTFAAEETYVVVASGIVSPSGYSPATPFNLHVYEGARESASVMSNTDLLVFHGSTDAPTVDVVETLRGAGTVIDDFEYAQFRGYLELATDDYELEIRTSDQSVTVVGYQAPLQTLGLDGQALVVVASGFLNPANNSNGEAFGLWVALPSGGNLIPLPTSTTSVSEMSSLNWSVYPNPVSDYLYIENADYNNDVLAQLTDNSGKTILNINLDGQNTIDLSGFNNGTYFLRLISGNESYVETIIINR
jgi:hypothetical protein